MTRKAHQSTGGSNPTDNGAVTGAKAAPPDSAGAAANPAPAVTSPAPADPCERQVRLRTTAILSLLAALFGVGLIAMEAVYRVRQSQEIALAPETVEIGAVTVEVRETTGQAPTAESTGAPATAADVAAISAAAPGAAGGAEPAAEAGAAESTGEGASGDAPGVAALEAEAEALAQARERIAELEREGAQLREELAAHQSALASGELALMEAQRQLDAARANAGGAGCGALLADLGALGMTTRLTPAGLCIALSAGDLQFASGSADLAENAGRERLRVLADWLADYPGQRIRVIGYTDASGREEANQALSAARAEAVREALITMGVDPAQLSAEGRGEREPIADNATPEGREQNRRVELLLETGT